MLRGRLVVCAGAVAAALLLASAASADHAVAVFPQAPVLALTETLSDAPPGFYDYVLIFSASWAPEASRYEGTLTMNDLTDGVTDRASFYDPGAVPRTSDVLRTNWTGVGGYQYLFQTHWTVYGRDNNFDYGFGIGESPLTLLTPPVIAIRIFGDDLQHALRRVGGRGFGATDALLSIVNQLGRQPLAAAEPPATARVAALVGASVAVESAALQSASLTVHDRAYRRVPRVARLGAPVVVAGGGLTTTQASAANAYLATTTSAIASARALGAAADRAAAARDAHKRRLQRLQTAAAAMFARRLAGLLARQPADAARLRAALGSGVTTATQDEMKTFQLAAASDSYPPDASATFAELRATKDERSTIRGGLLAPDPTRLDGDGLGDLAAPSDYAAASRLLRAFARR